MCAVFKHCFHFDVLCLCGLPLLEAQEGSQIFLLRDFFFLFRLLISVCFSVFFSPLDLRDLSRSLWLWSLSSSTAPQSRLQLLLVSNFSSGSCHLLLPAGHIHAEGWGDCGPGQNSGGRGCWVHFSWWDWKNKPRPETYTQAEKLFSMNADQQEPLIQGFHTTFFALRLWKSGDCSLGLCKKASLWNNHALYSKIETFQLQNLYLYVCYVPWDFTHFYREFLI